MNTKLTFLALCMCLLQTVYAQEKLWTERDRKYVITQFERTRDALVKETAHLTPRQWTFRESPDRWSIAEIVEHLALWEIIWSREISIGTRNKPQPDLLKTARPDSYYQEFIMEPQPHKSPELALPTGFITGKNTLDFFLRGREQNLAFLRTTDADMRSLFELTATADPRNMHQVLIYQWGHIDRHLRQILKVKNHPDYPRQ